MTPQQKYRRNIAIGIAIILAGIAYLPINIADDVVIGLGQIDDIVEPIVIALDLFWILYSWIRMMRLGKATTEDAAHAAEQIVDIARRPARSHPVQQVGQIRIKR